MNTLEKENLESKTDVQTKCGLVALIGPANSGKSSLVNALVGNKISIVTAKEQTTRFNVLGVRTENNSQIIFVDRPGFLARRYRGALSRFIASQTAESTHGCDVIALVLDVAMAIKDKQYTQAFFSLQRPTSGLLADPVVESPELSDGEHNFSLFQA